MIVNFSCLKLVMGWKAIYAGYGSKMTIICKKIYKNNGKKGLHNEIPQDSDTGWK